MTREEMWEEYERQNAAVYFTNQELVEYEKYIATSSFEEEYHYTRDGLRAERTIDNLTEEICELGIPDWEGLQRVHETFQQTIDRVHANLRSSSGVISEYWRQYNQTHSDFTRYNKEAEEAYEAYLEPREEEFWVCELCNKITGGDCPYPAKPCV